MNNQSKVDVPGLVNDGVLCIKSFNRPLSDYLFATPSAEKSPSSIEKSPVVLECINLKEPLS